MKVYRRSTVLVFLALFFSSSDAASTINIFFSNDTPFDFTIKPSAANYCIDDFDTEPFTLSSRGNRTYYATVQDDCDNANITFDYSQTYNPVPAENARAIIGTLTYQHFQQGADWKAELHMQLTPPVADPKLVLFRTACGDKFLYCGSAPVTLPSKNFFASFTVIPVVVTWGLGALTR
ncbi:hypothetical protein [Bordetella bronchialis]|uniref:Uncharacterized protein n=1 Tax=Bordetella bronchialis TaxID=463025 RepID=A0ABM6CUL7_9BORD|nr:hypothetical protein [Bordetella bronchialis]ANN67803.1 hypothetical protein BAU06_17215 [Bordetella bronchialis]